MTRKTCSTPLRNWGKCDGHSSFVHSAERMELDGWRHRLIAHYTCAIRLDEVRQTQYYYRYNVDHATGLNVPMGNALNFHSNVSTFVSPNSAIFFFTYSSIFKWTGGLQTNERVSRRDRALHLSLRAKIEIAHSKVKHNNNNNNNNQGYLQCERRNTANNITKDFGRKIEKHRRVTSIRMSLHRITASTQNRIIICPVRTRERDLFPHTN